MHMSDDVRLSRCQKAALLISLALIALGTGALSLDSTSAGVIGLKVQKAEVIYGALWVALLCSVLCSWRAASVAFTALRHSALSIANGLTYKKILALGIAAYPNYQERAGHFKYSEMPKAGFLRRTASIVIGTKANGTAELGTYDVSAWTLCPQLIAAHLRAVFVEGRGAIFLPYVAAIAAVFVSLGTGWSGSPYELLRATYA